MRQTKGSGQRIWLEFPVEVSAVPVITERRNKKRRVHRTYHNLHVHCVQKNPFRFIVTDVVNDAEWVVEEGADRHLVIVEIPDGSVIKETTVLAAIYRSWPQLKGRIK